MLRNHNKGYDTCTNRDTLSVAANWQRFDISVVELDWALARQQVP